MADPKPRKKTTTSASAGKEKKKPARGTARAAKEPSGSSRAGKGAHVAKKELDGAGQKETSAAKKGRGSKGSQAERLEKSKKVAADTAATAETGGRRAKAQAVKQADSSPSESPKKTSKAVGKPAKAKPGTGSARVAERSMPKKSAELAELSPPGQAKPKISQVQVPSVESNSGTKQGGRGAQKGSRPKGLDRPGQALQTPVVQDTLFSETEEKETAEVVAAEAIATVETADRKVVADFSLLGLHEGVLAALKRVKYVRPTDVQALCLPHTIEGRDIAGFAQTGTGKTAVFLITASHRLLSEEMKSGEKGAPAVLVLVPTRELAAQIQSEADALLKELKITTLSIFGGSADIDKQTKALAAGVDVVVATPGRLFDLHRQGAISFDHVGLLVCDEADRMLDMGFVEDVERVLTLIPEKSQKLLFSATGSTKVHELAFEFLNNPEYIETTPEHITPENITQWCYATRAEEKFRVLLSSIREQNPTCAIVFTNTKVVAEWVGYKLAANGIEAEVLTGDIPQNRRLSLIKAIKNGEMKVLVATDVLSRGLHVTGLSHVYNFDVPDEPESFIHRIGRTARAGAKGSAITLVCEDYGYNMGAVEELLGFSVEMKDIPTAWLETEDRSDFPFDSTGRVKSIRSLQGAETGSASDSVTEAPVSERPLSPHAERPRPDRGPRPERDGHGGPAARSDQRNTDRSPHDRERMPAAAAARVSDRVAVESAPELIDNGRDAMRERTADRSGVRGGPGSQQPSAGNRPFGRRAPDERSARPERSYEERVQPARDRASRPADAYAATGAGFSEQRRSQSDSRATGASATRESKFVRRDERAKEVIEAALLAAARERELHSLAALRQEVDQLGSRLKSPELARKTVQKLGGGLVNAVRKAAPGLGGFLKRLGSLLEEPQESPVRFHSEDESGQTKGEPRRRKPNDAGRADSMPVQNERGGRPAADRDDWSHKRRSSSAVNGGESDAARKDRFGERQDNTSPSRHPRNHQADASGDRGPAPQRVREVEPESRVSFEREDSAGSIPVVEGEVIDQRQGFAQPVSTDAGHPRKQWRGNGQNDHRGPRRSHPHDRDRRRPERR
jgi:ATP-dependent RNA helicase RhlB